MALFVDTVTITVKAGNGGNGCVSFHREKYVTDGGPDGGDGGKGGNIIFVASEHMHTLMDFRFERKFFAENGEDGGSARCKGRSGKDIVITVPAGTIVREPESGKLLLDLYAPDEKKVLLYGGKGGFGNMHFATPTRRAPDFAKPGIKTNAKQVTLELKSIADVGLVGFPNVGKSTILSVVTSAKPKVANYHFTTLQPNLGIVRTDENSFVLADIPGLVEGASAGIGLGHDFLRHIERTRVLIHVLDISGSESRNPLEDYDIIMRELSEYGNLSEKPMIIAANKIDIPGSEENMIRLKNKLAGTGIEIYPVCAVKGSGFKELMRAASKILDSLPPAEPFREEEIDFVDDLDSYEVLKISDEIFELSGPAIDKLIAAINFSSEDSLNYFHRTLRRIGAIDRLREAGAHEGSTVRIEDMEFDFVE